MNEFRKKCSGLKLAQIIKDGTPLNMEVELAATFGKRFLGLMFRKQMPEDHALLLVPCNAIHTFSMRFPIDVVYIDESGEVLKIDEAVPVRKVCKKVNGAKYVLELCAHTAKNRGLGTGDRLAIQY